MVTAFVPTKIIDIDVTDSCLEERIRAIQLLNGYQRILALVRRDGQPVGYLMHDLSSDICGNEAQCDLIMSAIRMKFGPSTNESAHSRCSQQVPETSRPSGTPTAQSSAEARFPKNPLVTIVIGTRDRTNQLRRCLESIASLDYSNFEVIVVDSAPATHTTRDLLSHSRVIPQPIRYLFEDRPGLAIAHNTGLRYAAGEIVAFTDDDVCVDRQWLHELVNGFNAGTNVGCVTGLIFPAELETLAQHYTEQFGGFGKGFSLRKFDLANAMPNSLLPYTTGICGSGANMAFTRSALRRIGGFDSALGVGSHARGGDDLESFFRVLTTGHQIVYNPGAVVFHWHRRDYIDLQRQAYSYGVGLGAYLTAIIVREPQRVWDMFRRLPNAMQHLLSPDSPKNRPKVVDFPTELVIRERLGILVGPLAYVRSKWQTRLVERVREADRQPVDLSAARNS